MPDQLTCPVCERPGVPVNSARCPQCDADLTCFQALDSLAEEKKAAPAEEATGAGKGAKRKSSASSRRAVLLLLLLLVLLGSILFFLNLKAKDRLQNLTQRVASLATELKIAEQKNEQTEQALCSLPDSERVGTAEEESFEEDDPLIYAEDGEEEKEKGNSTGGAERASSVTKSGEGSAELDEEQDVSRKEEMLAGGSTTEEAIGEESGADPLVLTGETETASTTEEASTESLPLMREKQWSKNTFLYLVKETDTLWGLAERFYGNGKYYPVIMEQNPRLVISDIHDEEGLRFLNDRTLLKDMYQRRIEWRDGLALWKHQVRAGETRQAIEKRFAAPGSSGRVLYEKNPDIRPGATVRVVLY